MKQKRPRPPHLASEEKPPKNITHRVLSPITWHYPPLELNLMPPERVAAAVAGRTTFDAELLLARQVLEDKQSCLPHITGFGSVREVQVVRNNLLEHVEGKASGITERRWTFSLKEGPMIKDVRRRDQPRRHRDPGLYPTAEKLRLAVAHVYDRALNVIAAEPVTYPPLVEHREPKT